MLSIVICSANKAYLANLKINLAETVGCDFEILSYPNEHGQKGICEIYNQGAKDAAYEIVCFMHEDVRILTEGWGKIVVTHFSENPDLGLLGVAGGDYKSLAPSSWYNFEAPDDLAGRFYINVIQDHKLSDSETVHDYSNPRNEQLSRVACIDGVWMCTRKAIGQEIKFDEPLLQGFHGYDLDYSLAVNQRYRVAVTYQILLHHFSEGRFDDAWLKDTLKVHKKWSRHLPVNFAGFSAEEMVGIEKKLFKLFFIRRFREGSTRRVLIRILWQSRISSVMKPALLLSLFTFIVKLSRKNL